MMSQWHLVLEILTLILYRIFLVFYSCILFFYVFNSNLIHFFFYLNLIKLYVYIFNVKHQEQLRWCGAKQIPNLLLLLLLYYVVLEEVQHILVCLIMACLADANFNVTMVLLWAPVLFWALLITILEARQCSMLFWLIWSCW